MSVVYVAGRVQAILQVQTLRPDDQAVFARLAGEDSRMATVGSQVVTTAISLSDACAGQSGRW
jgi:hypothetical protein